MFLAPKIMLQVAAADIRQLTDLQPCGSAREFAVCDGSLTPIQPSGASAGQRPESVICQVVSEGACHEAS